MILRSTSQVYPITALVAAHLSHESIGRTVLVRSVLDTRPADVKWYIEDNGKVAEATGSQSKRTPHDILVLIGTWLKEAGPAEQ